MRKPDNIALKADEAEAIIRTLELAQRAVENGRNGSLILDGPTPAAAIESVVKFLNGKLNSGNGAPT
jgi:hypothetical protein